VTVRFARPIVVGHCRVDQCNVGATDLMKAEGQDRVEANVHGQAARRVGQTPVRSNRG
jgi:hypothetical protein